jgi:hypothetical protein
MPLIHTCRARDCQTLTMGGLCLDHERLAEERILARARARVVRLQAPVIGLAFALAAALIGRASARFGS